MSLSITMVQMMEKVLDESDLLSLNVSLFNLSFRPLVDQSIGRSSISRRVKLRNCDNEKLFRYTVKCRIIS